VAKYPLIGRKSVELILGAVGEKFVPRDIDKDKLRRRLNFSATWRHIQIESSKPRMKQRRASEIRIRRHAKKLRKLLSEREIWLCIPGSQQLIEALDDMLEHKSANSEQIQEPFETWKSRSPNEWLAGHHLPHVYEELFGRPAGRSWKHNEPSGPCVHFIHAAMKEMGLRYSGKSIIRAMTEARSSPQRRRKR
jgi:hypothetical protein